MTQTAEDSQKTEEHREIKDTEETEDTSEPKGTGEVAATKETEEIVEETLEEAEKPKRKEIEEETEEEEEIVEETLEEAEKPKRKEIEEEIVEEKIYTIPLGKAWISQRKKRAPRAGRILKKFIQRHMKIKTEAEEGEETERLVVSNEVNEKIWSRGIEKPPRKIRVRAAKDKEGVITVYLAEGD